MTITMEEKASVKKSEFFYDRIRILRLIGCWPLIGVYKTKKEFFYLLNTSFLVLNSVVASFLTFYSSILVFINHGQFDEEVCNQIIVFIIAFQLFSKLVIMLINAGKIRKLTDELNNDLCGEFVVCDTDSEIINKCHKYDKKLAIFLCTFSVLVTVANMLKPLLETINRKLKQVSENSPPVMGVIPSKYFFDVEALSFWYCFWYIQEWFYVFPGAMISWISDSMFCSFLYYLCGHFDILINNIKNGDGYINTSVGRKKLVIHHLTLINYANKLILVFAPIMVIQLLLGALTIGCLVMQFFLISEGSLTQYFKPFSYLVLKLVQLYVLCWHGQLLLNKSVAVGKAAYFSSWYTKPRSCCLDLKIIMIRSSKPIKFAYAGIFQFSARRFTSILNAAYGYFAMMNTLKQE